jgi:hypothetical protein
MHKGSHNVAGQSDTRFVVFLVVGGIVVVLAIFGIGRLLSRSITPDVPAVATTTDAKTPTPEASTEPADAEAASDGEAAEDTDDAPVMSLDEAQSDWAAARADAEEDHHDAILADDGSVSHSDGRKQVNQGYVGSGYSGTRATSSASRGSGAGSGGAPAGYEGRGRISPDDE